MNQDEDFIISSPYKITREDESLIKRASPVAKKPTDWKKSSLEGFKKRVRDFYFVRQNRRCAYCRTIIKTSQASSEIEHIVPKSAHNSDWMYEPFNLCLSCHMCNTKKNTKKLLKESVNTYAVLPQDSSEYIIIHPHRDKYSKHIQIIDDIIYKGISDKGEKTIEICNLDRYELAVDRAEEKMIKEGTVDEKILYGLIKSDESSMVDDVDKFMERIKNICRQYIEGRCDG